MPLATLIIPAIIYDWFFPFVTPRIEVRDRYRFPVFCWFRAFADPGMNGLETYRRIIEIHPGQKAIIVSGFFQDGLGEKSPGAGRRAGAYVKKPYLREKIGMAVWEELNRKTPGG